ncbi:putative transporter YwrA [Weizmannia acidilactici]|nr:putative transporter YwrA [Weizmannia acidilactici]
MKVKYRDIFMAFCRAGLLGFGGGLSAIPLMHREVVKVYKWMGDEEFSDILALANTLPGPINTKMSGYLGYRVRGIPGMLVALVGTVVPTVILMIVFLTALNAYKDKPWVQGMSKAVVTVAGVMLGMLTWGFVKKSIEAIGWLLTMIVMAAGVVVMVVLGIHPAFLIGALLAIALLTKKDFDQKKQEHAS